MWLPWQLYRDGGMCSLHQDLCSCGSRFSECDIWRKIVDRLNKRVGFDVCSDPFRFKMSIFAQERYGSKPKISDRIMREINLRFLQYTRWRVVSKVFQSFSQVSVLNNWMLFDIICETCNVDFIVDSSKSIARWNMLKSARPKDVKLIVLFRDLIEVAASSARRGHNPIKSGYSWVSFYKKLSKVLLKMSPQEFLLVRYEDLTINPAKVRKNVSQFLRLGDPGDNILIDTRRHHLVAGNPMRYQGRISIRHDDSWKTVLPKDLIKSINQNFGDVSLEIYNKLEQLQKSPTP